MLKSAITIASLAVIAAGVAQAGDGRFEINQNCVATGCVPGDTPGFPVETEQGKSYVLTSSLVVPDANTTGVSLGARSLLDLNGFSISGVTTCTGTPVTSCTPTGTGTGVYADDLSEIRNGKISRMGNYGIGGNGGVRVESVVVEQSGSHGLFFNYSSDGPEANLVRDSHIARNGGMGVLESGGFQGVGTLITGNVIWGNKDEGASGGSMLITNNTFSRNGDEGVLGESAVGGNTFVYNNGGNDQPQTGGIVQIAPNFCGDDTTCP
jgi:hypothetical protein